MEKFWTQPKTAEKESVENNWQEKEKKSFAGKGGKIAAALLVMSAILLNRVPGISEAYAADNLDDSSKKESIQSKEQRAVECLKKIFNAPVFDKENPEKNKIEQQIYAWTQILFYVNGEGNVEKKVPPEKLQSAVKELKENIGRFVDEYYGSGKGDTSSDKVKEYENILETTHNAGMETMHKIENEVIK